MQKKEFPCTTNISRRQFIGGASVLALAGVAGLAGCKAVAAQAATSPPVTVTVTATPAATTQPPNTKAVNWPMDIIGTFTATPAKAAIGDTVTAAGKGFKALATYDLMWQDMTGVWNMVNGEFKGRSFTESYIKLATITTDAAGSFSIPFAVPEGFGFSHDLVVLDNGVIRNKLDYQVLMQVTITPAQGVLGTPIVIDVKGMGWADYQNGWHVHYDNQETGDVTATSTHGTARAVIPATGAPGKHIIRVIEGAYTVAYQNHEECPFPDTPTFNLEYNLIAGDAVMPAAYNTQVLPNLTSSAPAPTGKPQIWADIVRAPVGTPFKVTGMQFQPNTAIDLNYWVTTGNRVSGGGFELVKTPFGSVTTDPNGSFEFKTVYPDTIGGDRLLEADIADTKLAQTTFTIIPSITSMQPVSGPVGTPAHFVVKGLSWTVSAKDCYICYDNSKIGYACAMTSKGTLNVFLPMTGTPGWHYVDFWPGVYKGTDPASIEQYRNPLLALADHPGEVASAFHFAFQITP